MYESREVESYFPCRLLPRSEHAIYEPHAFEERHGCPRTMILAPVPQCAAERILVGKLNLPACGNPAPEPGHFLSNAL